MITRCMAWWCLGLLLLHVNYANAQIEYVLRDFPVEQDGGRLVGSITVADTAADDGMLMEDEILAFEWAAFDADGVQAATASSMMDGAFIWTSDVLIDPQQIVVPGRPSEGAILNLGTRLESANPVEVNLNALTYQFDHDYYRYLAESPGIGGDNCFIEWCNPVWHYTGGIELPNGGAPGGEPWVIAVVPEPEQTLNGISVVVLAIMALRNKRSR